MQDSLIWLGEWQVNPDQNTLVSSSESKKLENKPMQVLLHLIANDGKLVTKEQLIEQVWQGRVVSDDAIAVAVSQIRKALSDQARAPRFIKTIPGKGYCLIAKVRYQSIPSLETSQSTEQQELAKQQTCAGPSSKRPLLLATIIVLLIAVLYYVQNADLTKAVEPLRKVDEPMQKVDEPDVVVKQARQLLGSEKLENWRQALLILEQAVDDNADNADYYLLIAQAKFNILNIQYHQLDEQLPEYRFLLTRAFELDSRNADIHLLLARMYFLVDWHYPKAEYHFQQAINLDRKNTGSYFHYVNFLLAVNKLAAAKEQIQQIRQIAPHTYSLPMMAWVLNMQRDYDQAMKETEKLLTLNPNRFAYHWSAQSINENRGHSEEALQQMLKLLDTIKYSQDERGQLRTIAEQQGLSGVYHWLLHTKQEMRDIGQYQPPLSFARYALASGDKNLALDYLEQALAIKQTEILWLNVDPKYDVLRKEPRFQAIIAQLGLANSH